MMKKQTMRAFASQIVSLAMAVLIAFVIWSIATSEQNPSREGFFPSELAIEIVNRADGLIVYQKTVETVRVQVRAPQASWDQLRPASFRVAADLQSRGAGLHQIPLTVQVADPRVTVIDVDPAEVGIRLEQLKTREFPVHGDVLDAAPLGYTFQPPVINPLTATVNGPAILVDQVAEIVADIFLRGAKSPIERETAVIARDAQGKAVLGATIAPASVLVKVKIEQRVGYKDVSIKTVLKGNVAPGFWISNITVAPTAATIVGNADVLAKIPGFVETLPIDVEGATADVNKRAVLALPDGVSILDSEGVTVQVAVVPIIGGQTVRRPIALQGLRAGLKATTAPDSVEVILSGPVSVLQNLAPNDVQVALDVAGLAPGTHSIKPRVPSLPSMLKVQNIVPDSIQVMIIDPTPPATATVPITSTITLTPPFTVTATRPITITPTLTVTATRPIPLTTTPQPVPTR